jgi:hypothetical protein
MKVTSIQYKDSSGLNYKVRFILDYLICTIHYHPAIHGLRHRISTHWHIIQTIQNACT